MAKRRRPWKTAIVYWDDAYKTQRPEPASGALQVSSGILISNTKAHIKLAQIACPWGIYEERDILTIPREMVRHVQIVKHDWRP